MMTRLITQILLTLTLILGFSLSSSLSGASIDKTPKKKIPTMNDKRTVTDKLNEHLDKQKGKENKEEKLKLTDKSKTSSAADVFIKIPDIEGESTREKASSEMKIKASKINQNKPSIETTKLIQQETSQTKSTTDNTNTKSGGINTISSTKKCSKKGVNSVEKDEICKKDSSE